MRSRIIMKMLKSDHNTTTTNTTTDDHMIPASSSPSSNNALAAPKIESNELPIYRVFVSAEGKRITHLHSKYSVGNANGNKNTTTAAATTKEKRVAPFTDSSVMLALMYGK
ncbi:hypothetical protein ACFE04_022674 [Oxalis oulophora]